MTQVSFNDLDYDSLEKASTTMLSKIAKILVAISFFGLFISIAINENVPGKLSAIFFALIIASIILAWHQYAVVKKTLMKFARENGLKYVAKKTSKTTEDDGIIFGIGRSHVFYNMLSGLHNDAPAQFYKYSYTTGSGKHRQTHSYYVYSVKLKGNLPYILLDSMENNFGFLSNLPRWPSKDSQVTLEGDFQNHFKMYSSVADTSDPLTIITPDVMQELINVDGDYDIEINNGNLILFTKANTSFAQTMSNMSEIADKLLQSLRSNISHYSAPVPAHQRAMEQSAKSLKKNKWPAVIAVGVFIIIFILQMFL